MSQKTSAKNEYVHSEVLCETDWVAGNLRNPEIRVLEVDYDPENAYRQDIC
jgi:thiosulfate/3-mercaptopyruvate sulfurtransferase